MRAILSLLLLFSFVYAEIVFDDTIPPVKEEIIDYDSVQNDDNEVIPQEELNKNSQEILEDVIKTKHTIQRAKKYHQNEQNLYLNIQKQPKKAILSQRVAFVLKATITRDDTKKLSSSFSTDSSYNILNKDEPWQKIDENSFKVVYYMQFLSTSAKFPTITVEAEFSDATKEKRAIKIEPIKIVALKSDEYFCDVIADDLTINSHTQKIYDDNTNIVLIEIDANNSNLADFKIEYAKKSGVDEYIDKGKSQKAYAYAIVDKGLKEFKFKYFNSKTNHYKMLSFPIILKDQTLSTQTELNPQKSKFRLYKTIALLLIAFIMLLFTLKNRSKLLASIAVLILLYTAYINFPLKKITLHKGDGLKILPTQNSTAFYIVPHDMEATVVYENKKYYKVLLPDNQHIGWIKKDDK